MMKSNFVTIFMVFIVICLPIYSANVIAGSTGTVHNVTVKGADTDTEDFVSSVDSVEVTTEVSKSKDGESVEISPDNLLIFINGEGTHDFENCEEDGDRFVCKYVGSDRSWDSGTHSTEVRLYDSNRVEKFDSLSKSFYVNDLDPEIVEFSVPSTGTTEPMDIEYSLQDRACDGCGNVCIGLDELFLTDNEGDVVYSNESLGGCSHSAKLNKSPEELGLSKGENELCIEVIDKGGLSSSECSSILVDYDAPEYISSNITDDAGNTIDYSSSGVIEGNLNVQVYKDISGLEKDDIEADLTGLYPDAGEKIRKPDECTEEDKIYTCTWEGVGIHGVDDGTGDVNVTVTDTSGNTMEKTLSFDFPLDDTKPSLEDIYTPNDEYLNASENTIIMEIVEEDSGLADGDAYLNLAQVNSAYSSSTKADYCELDGNWKCYWENLSVGGSIEHGREVSVYLDEIRDVAGNVVTDDTEEIFIYDGEEPEIFNVTLQPKDEDYETIPAGVGAIEIKAYIKDGVSGITEENVYANYADIAPEEDWTSADACVEENETNYVCTWEYAKDNFVPGEWIELDLRVFDNAENRAFEEDAGRAFVADVTDEEPDYWEEDATGQSQSRLNPNHLWMSSSGTLVRATVSLSSKGSGDPYIHYMDLEECKGTLKNNGDDDYRDYDIYEQGHIDEEKEAKYLILDVPNYENKSKVPDGGTMEIVCAGKVLQSSSEHGSIYDVDERFNATINVDLMEGLFQEPGSSTVNRLHESSSLIEFIDEVTGYIDKASFIRDLCQGFQVIREVVNGICMIWDGVSVIWGGTGSSICDRVVPLMERLWYGSSHEEGVGREVGDGSWGSTKDAFSVGFICDLFLCTDCSKQWNYMFSEKLDTEFHTDILGLEGKSGTDDFNFYLGETPLTFNPHRSLPVAVICMPPCLSGIQNNLIIWKQIEVNYNVCLNIQAVRGESTSVCSEYKTSQICQEVFAQIWVFFESGFAQFVANTILGNVEMIFEEDSEIMEKCRETGSAPERVASGCSPLIVYEVLGWMVTLDETWRQIQNIGQLSESFKDKTEAREHVESELDEFDEGESPYD